jgi:hypothetical protein
LAVLWIGFEPRKAKKVSKKEKEMKNLTFDELSGRLEASLKP